MTWIDKSDMRGARLDRRSSQPPPLAASRSVNLGSLLATHELPFRIIDGHLTVIAVNPAYERVFGEADGFTLGLPCCADVGASGAVCRHRQAFRELEPYTALETLNSSGSEVVLCRVRGYPLVDADGSILLGEALSPVVAPARTTGQSSRMLGRAPNFQALLQSLEQAASTDIAVLLEGETGTGKELAAHYIHVHSQRADHPFVTVDCTVLTDDLFESELFGHEKGAFTGAAGRKEGLIELANGGTLFLDEVGELPLAQQPKLLRVLESGTLRRVGSNEWRQVDIRIVAATNQNLAAMAEAGQFRKDLFYRLSGYPIRLPPLRERRADIVLLSQYFVAAHAAASQRPLELDPAALDKLRLHAFPGNVRELKNCLQLAVALSPRDRIMPDHIVLQSAGSAAFGPPPTVASTPNMSSVFSPVEAMEATYIKSLLAQFDGSRRLAAQAMDISERTLYRKLKRYGIE